MNIRRLQLDVDKAIARPDLLELARAEHELNFTESGRLATTHLGRVVA